MPRNAACVRAGQTSSIQLGARARAGTGSRRGSGRACRTAAPRRDTRGRATTSRRATTLRLRSGASVTDGNESMAETSSGRSRAADAGELGREHEQVGAVRKRRQRPREHQRERGTRRAAPRRRPAPAPRPRTRAARGGRPRATRCRSSGPPHASSGWRSTSHAWRSEYVSTKWRSSCTWNPWSTA